MFVKWFLFQVLKCLVRFFIRYEDMRSEKRESEKLQWVDKVLSSKIRLTYRRLKY